MLAVPVEDVVPDLVVTPNPLIATRYPGIGPILSWSPTEIRWGWLPGNIPGADMSTQTCVPVCFTAPRWRCGLGEVEALWEPISSTAFYQKLR
jgi:hypothetical protein